MSNTTYHQENLRARLIEAGIQLINERGYEALSLRQIAAACQVSHTAPYRHFKDKEELLASMQAYVEAQFTQILTQALPKNNDSACMIAFGQAYVMFFMKNPQYYEFFTHQKNIQIILSEADHTAVSNYAPFLIFQNAASKHLAIHQVPTELYLSKLTAMWATVHGLAGLATMSGVTYDGDWEVLTEHILKGVSSHEAAINHP